MQRSGLTNENMFYFFLSLEVFTRQYNASAQTYGHFEQNSTWSKEKGGRSVRIRQPHFVSRISVSRGGGGNRFRAYR